MAVPISVWLHQDNSSEKKMLFYIIMLSVSIILLLFRFIPFYLAKTKNRLKVILDYYDRDPCFQKYAQIENVNISAITYDTYRDTCYFHTELEKNRRVLNTGVAFAIVLFSWYPSCFRAFH